MTKQRRLAQGFAAAAALGIAAYNAQLVWRSGGGANRQTIVVMLVCALLGVVGLLDACFCLLDRWRRQPFSMLDTLQDLQHATDTLSAPARAMIVDHIAAPVADLVGREQVLHALAQRPERGVAIWGTGGIGKTELARALARRLAERYPDGAMTIALHGALERPGDPAQALASALWLLTGQATADDCALAERRDRYRQALQGKKMIVLLDGASDADQVEPLLPPSPSLVIVTSRQELALPGLARCALDPLSANASEALLLGICPRIGDQAADLARACGDLPLALRLAAGALAHDDDLDPRQYLRLLSAQDDGLTTVERALRVSQGLLTDEEQDLWRQLTVFPADFDASAVAAVWDLSQASAQSALDALLARGLVAWEATTQRYSLRDSVRRFVLDQGPAAEAQTLQAAHLRFAQHFQQVLARADKGYQQGEQGVTQGLALFDQEWPNIQVGQAWATAHAYQVSGALALANAYCAPSELLDLRLLPAERINWLISAVHAAQALGLKQEEAQHLGNLGLASFDLGEVDKAIELYERALAMDRELGDRRGEGQDLSNLGLAYAELGQIEQAIACYDQSLEISQALDDWSGASLDLTNLGNAYGDLGDNESALSYHAQALDLAREIGDQRSQGIALGNLGNAYAALGQAERAIAYYGEALAMAGAIEDQGGQANHHYNLGDELVKLGQPDAAREHFTAALALFEALDSPHADLARQALNALDAG